MFASGAAATLSIERRAHTANDSPMPEIASSATAPDAVATFSIERQAHAANDSPRLEIASFATAPDAAATFSIERLAHTANDSPRLEIASSSTTPDGDVDLAEVDLEMGFDTTPEVVAPDEEIAHAAGPDDHDSTPLPCLLVARDQKSCEEFHRRVRGDGTTNPNSCDDSVAKSSFDSARNSAEAFEQSRLPFEAVGRIPKVAYECDGKILLAVSFAFINGWIDALSLRKYNAFATMMVGNMLLLGNSLAVVLDGQFTRPSVTWIPDPLFYTTLIVVFLVGIVIFRLLEKWRGWTARTIAPAIAFWMIFHDVLEWSDVDQFKAPSRWNVLRIAPVFGIQDAITLRQGGLATLPWCTTGHVVTIGVTMAEFSTGVVSAEQKRKCAFALAMMASMILGAIAGMTFDTITEESLDWDYALLAPALALLFCAHDRVFDLKPTPPKVEAI